MFSCYTVYYVSMFWQLMLRSLTKTEIPNCEVGSCKRAPRPGDQQEHYVTCQQIPPGKNPKCLGKLIVGLQAQSPEKRIFEHVVRIRQEWKDSTEHGCSKSCAGMLSASWQPLFNAYKDGNPGINPNNVGTPLRRGPCSMIFTRKLFKILNCLTGPE